MKKETGATMIEVLVTILILAVGLLGLSATQVMSLKNGNNAHHRYMAAMAAQEMAERMRANPGGVQLGSYDNKTVKGEESSQSCSTRCGAGQIATLDLYEWGQVISTNLPSGTGEIERIGDEVTITVNWKAQNTGENRGGASALDDASFELVVEL